MCKRRHGKYKRWKRAIKPLSAKVAAGTRKPSRPTQSVAKPAGGQTYINRTLSMQARLPSAAGMVPTSFDCVVASELSVAVKPS